MLQGDHHIQTVLSRDVHDRALHFVRCSAQAHHVAARRVDPQLERLCYEYLPITFGRRHGDPSRPWNRFAIRLKDEFGNRLLSYEGNWRDIFQNWEALTFSYPGFIENVIAKFVNASTMDGYNPYRITKDGIDWEVEEPDDPWSYIGYWGDHQIIYLQKLLELSEQFHPTHLAQLLHQPVFSYANVPYRIKSFEDLLRQAWEASRNEVDLRWHWQALTGEGWLACCIDSSGRPEKCSPPQTSGVCFTFRAQWLSISQSAASLSSGRCRFATLTPLVPFGTKSPTPYRGGSDTLAPDR